MSAKLSSNYNPAIDLLRIFSILAVIMIHTSTKTIQAVSGNISLVPWTLFLNQTSRFAVPLFFLISGFVLELSSPGDLNYWAYLKKRLSRIFIPYLIWSLVYYFIIYPGNSLNFFSVLLSGGASYQLYFIPTLLVFYLFFPLFHRYYYFLSRKLVLIILGIIQLFFLFHDYYLGSYAIFYPLNIALLNFYIFILGIVAFHYQSSLLIFAQKFKYFLSVITCLLVAYVFYEGGSRYAATGNYLAFYSQWRPSIFFYTLFLFLTLYYFFSHLHLVPSLIKTFSSLSFFVFFFHIIVLEIVWKTIYFHFFSQSSIFIVNNLWFDPLLFITITFLSFFIAYFCHKIPFLSRLTG